MKSPLMLALSSVSNYAYV